MAAGLQFRIREFRDELRVLGDLAAPFLAPGGEGVLEEFRRQVESLWGIAENSSITLRIDPTWPLQTIASAGAYEHGGGGRFKSLFCKIFLAWTVRPLGQPVKQPSGNRAFEISGEASTVIELFIDPFEELGDGHSGEELKVASWRMEMGNRTEAGQAFPGPLFHTQIPEVGALEEFRLWPHWLSVPRLPTMPFTPMAAIEFALAETFQENWVEYVESPGLQRNSLEQWARIQSLRLVAFLRWQQEVVSAAAGPTPLVALKMAAPQSDVFVGLT